jgi:hypothetical protein
MRAVILVHGMGVVHWWIAYSELLWCWFSGRSGVRLLHHLSVPCSGETTPATSISMCMLDPVAPVVRQAARLQECKSTVAGPSFYMYGAHFAMFAHL